MEKSVILIDAENVLRAWMYHCSTINDSQARIDYHKLIIALSQGTNLLRAYFYDGVPSNVPLNKKKFLEALQHQGIQLRTKILKTRTTTCKQCGTSETRTIQKGVDVALATDILRHAWQNTCEICIIVSGDEDYKDAIECAKDKGVKVWVCSFKPSLSSELARTADKIFYLEDLFGTIKR